MNHAIWKKVAIIVTVIFLLDQLTKWIAFVYLQPLISVNVVGDFFRLTYVENPGMAFGIRISNRFWYNFLSVVAVLVLLFYLFFLYPDRKKFSYSLAFILGGAFGNLFDRLMHGKVIDFLDFEFLDIHIPAFTLFGWNFPGFSMERWPVFNLADIAVSLGMIFLFLIVLTDREAVQGKTILTESSDPQ